MSFENEYRELMEKPIEEIRRIYSSAQITFNMSCGTVTFKCI